MPTARPGKEISPGGWFVLLLLLAVASWGTVAGEYRLTGQVTLMTVAPALLFTSFILLWPALDGVRGASKGQPRLEACHDCGSFILPMPGVPFCLRCGAFPKAKPLKQAASNAHAVP